MAHDIAIKLTAHESAFGNAPRPKQSCCRYPFLDCSPEGITRRCVFVPGQRIKGLAAFMAMALWWVMRLPCVSIGVRASRTRNGWRGRLSAPLLHPDRRGATSARGPSWRSMARMSAGPSHSVTEQARISNRKDKSAALRRLPSSFRLRLELMKESNRSLCVRGRLKDCTLVALQDA